MGAGDGVRCMLMRGGTSKGAYFLASDLPPDPAERDDLLLRVMGSPDLRQIDGIGGAHPLTSKVAVVSASGRDDADVDYLFLQAGVGEATVSDRQNCGNLLAGVGPFAVEPHKHAIQQTFFLYVYEPGGNRVELCNPAARLTGAGRLIGRPAGRRPAPRCPGRTPSSPRRPPAARPGRPPRPARTGRGSPSRTSPGPGRAPRGRT
jgi:hypothetical protein